MPGIATNWDDLVAHAVLGTDRRPVDGLGLLASAALEVARRRAGVTAVLDVPEPVPPPPESGVPASPAQQAVLEDVLRFDEANVATELVAELSERAEAAGVVAPPALLPWLLDLLGNKRSRVAVLPLLGNRGRWLAAHRPDWTDGLDRAQKEAGEQRPAAPPDPDAIRTRLARRWSRLSTESKVALLREFAEVAGLQDEERLEELLEERDRSVRCEAARVLAGIPGSALSRRATARARRYVRVESGRGGRRLFGSGAPADPSDPREARDSVDRILAANADVQRLSDAVAATPIAMWLAEFDTPEQAVAAVPDEAYGIVFGLVRAAVLQRDREWARALLARLAPRDDEFTQALYALVPDLMPAYAIRWLSCRPGEAPAGTPWDRLHAVLLHCPAPWPHDLTLAVLVRLHHDATTLDRATAAALQAESWHLWALRTLVQAADPTGNSADEIAAAVTALDPGGHPRWSGHVAEFHDLFQLRRRIHREFR